MEQWLIPFKGRRLSGAIYQNFLYRRNNIYIMDNHRAALWCWLQNIDEQENINLFHIDCHYDTLYSKIDEWLRICPDIKTISIDEYLSANYNVGGVLCPLFRWDNYLSIFLEKFSDRVNQAYFATHGEGDIPKFRNAQHIAPWDLPYIFKEKIEDSNNPFIVNIDLDYFVYPKNIDDEKKERLFSFEFLESIFIPLRGFIKNKKVITTTICLSPECTGGWPLAESICKDICQILEIDFSLPK